ncbi:hypothetical protein TRVL_05554 [Trypanosoma vivax]|nr:hypothetical protein TRVL_05554 [Trypanosoma vivax]
MAVSLFPRFLSLLCVFGCLQLLMLLRRSPSFMRYSSLRHSLCASAHAAPVLPKKCLAPVLPHFFAPHVLVPLFRCPECKSLASCVFRVLAVPASVACCVCPPRVRAVLPGPSSAAPACAFPVQCARLLVSRSVWLWRCLGL